jgi:hypothetical protein
MTIPLDILASFSKEKLKTKKLIKDIKRIIAPRNPTRIPEAKYVLVIKFFSFKF